MVAVTAGGLGPVLTGLVYCTAIACCSQLYVMDRAREWTAALAGWCAAQPDLVPFSGTCLVHRAELMQLARLVARGDRRGPARVGARVAAGRLAGDRGRVLPAGARSTGCAAIFRRRSAPIAAPASWGGKRSPGWRCCGLAQGRAADAVSAIRGALSATHGSPAPRPPAARRRRDSAGRRRRRRGPRRACERAGRASPRTSGPRSWARWRRTRSGAVELADGRPRAALEPLRRAFRVWHEVGAPYIARPAARADRARLPRAR